MAHTSVREDNLNYQKGITLLDQGQYALAAAEFERVLAKLDERDPSARLARFHLGEARAQLGIEMLRRHAPDRAEEEFRLALEINPRYADIRYQLARALSSKGKIDEALSELELALEINPAFAKAYFERGLMMCKAGEFAMGIGEVSRAVEIDPAYSKELYDSACMLCQDGNTREALDRLSDMASTNLDDIQYHFQLGKDCYKNGWHDRAAAEFRKALNLHAGYADVHNYLGLTLLATQKVEAAREEFEAALDINPKFVAATMNAGSACEAMGDVEGALEYYQTALEQDPDNIEAKKKLAQLKKLRV
ncbi:MAG: tetratricopeptide repeat protein [Armatimonadota bacterium]|nr:tetratricopeptide repeat protein [Armatimonadota bacterium]